MVGSIRGRIYRGLMRLAHRYDWHYAPRIGPFEDGRTQLWCKWCGFRETQGMARPMVRDDRVYNAIPVCKA